MLLARSVSLLLACYHVLSFVTGLCSANADIAAKLHEQTDHTSHTMLASLVFLNALLQPLLHPSTQAPVPCRKAFKDRDIHWALNQMGTSDKHARDVEAKNRACCKSLCMCESCLDLFKLWDSHFGFKETAEELDMLLAGTPPPPPRHTLLCGNTSTLYTASLHPVVFD